jgi:hypothetical protein
VPIFNRRRTLSSRFVESAALLTPEEKAEDVLADDASVSDEESLELWGA